MKIKKSDLKNIIKEELQEELELQEIYIPFIGGKLPGEELTKRRKQMQAILDAADEFDDDEKEEFESYYSNYLEGDDYFLSDRLEAGRLGQAYQALRPLMSKRHPKSEAQKLMNIFDNIADYLSNAIGGLPAELAAEKAEAAAEEKRRARERSDREEYERVAARRAERDRIARSNMDYDSKRRQSTGFGQSHRVNPGVAGSGNMAYGESIDKSELEKIIKEEIRKIIYKENK